MTNIVWYEPRYAVLPFVTEFWNAISSFSYCVVGCLWYPRAKSKNVEKLCLSLVSVGVGSAVFHGTSSYAGELWDESSMLLFSHYMLRSVATPTTLLRLPLHSWMKTLTCSGMLWYIYSGSHPFFSVLFGVNILVPGVLMVFEDKAKKNVYTSAGLMVLASLNWVAERCTGIHWFHSAWHLLSAQSAYYLISHINL